MRTLVLALIGLLACSHPPPPAPPAVEHPVKVFGDVAGNWVTSDDLDWFWALSIRADGDFELAIDRGKLGRCVTHATLVQSPVPPSFNLAVAVDECHRDQPAATITAVFPSFTGTALTLELTTGEETTHHTFTRAPVQRSSE